jgi:hypothetical protein
LNAGGNTLDIAIAMLEDEHMQTNYKYGRSSYTGSGSPVQVATLGFLRGGTSAEANFCGPLLIMPKLLNGDFCRQLLKRTNTQPPSSHTVTPFITIS